MDANGRGPAWSNSLFEDNAEFGLGFRVSLDKQREFAAELLQQLAPQLGDDLAAEILVASQQDEADIFDQRECVAELKRRLATLENDDARRLLALADTLVRKSVWIVGGDGWGYDIGFGGLDHVLASGRNVKVLLLDTEVYSNTGGQCSKATPRGAVAKFAAGGKAAPKKDLGLMAMTYGNVYVASVAMGAKDEHTLKAFLEAESYDGPALIIAYSHCIAHGINLSTAMQNQQAAVRSGQWLLYRHDPRRTKRGENPLQLDSAAPRIKVQDYLRLENRFRMLGQSHPDDANALFKQAQDDVDTRWGALPIPRRAPRQPRRQTPDGDQAMNLTTKYLGLDLRTPLVPSASPLSEDIDNLKRMEDAGASAIVFHSLFEEQIRHETHTLHHHLTHGTESYAEALSYFPEPDEFHFAPNRYLLNIVKAKQALGIPIIASLNGSTFGGWTNFSKSIEQAGADALELNIYSIPTDPDVAAEDIERNYLTIVASVKAQVKIPVAVKLSPFFTNFTRFARQLDQHGADGLVLFNRFYQPDIDLNTLEVSPTILLSTPMVMRLPLRWIAMLHGRIGASLGATSGICRGTDALKMLMAGADVTMLCSVLLRRGIEHLTVIEREMREWMEQHEYESVEQLKGSMSQKKCPDPGAFERAQYMRAIAVDREILPAT
jgi:dihydroorotate dehydrogenase (fumarate)